jgi:hypothetical protein
MATRTRGLRTSGGDVAARRRCPMRAAPRPRIPARAGGRGDGRRRQVPGLVAQRSSEQVESSQDPGETVFVRGTVNQQRSRLLEFL